MAPKWVVDVRDKLSRHDGFQLLKTLYYKDGIPERELDGASDVFRVYKLSKRYSNNDDGAAVALLFYRLSLLVPRSVYPGEVSAAALDPEKLRRAKDLGAEDCLDHFAKCGLSKPAEPSIPPEARLPECFAITYVNLSPRMRRDFKEQLSIVVGVYREKQLATCFVASRTAAARLPPTGLSKRSTTLKSPLRFLRNFKTSLIATIFNTHQLQ